LKGTGFSPWARSLHSGGKTPCTAENYRRQAFRAGGAAAGAKAQIFLVPFTARLKSCPDTKHPSHDYRNWAGSKDEPVPLGAAENYPGRSPGYPRAVLVRRSAPAQNPWGLAVVGASWVSPRAALPSAPQPSHTGRENNRRRGLPWPGQSPRLCRSRGPTH
jgi:hypothetical protein